MTALSANCPCHVCTVAFDMETWTGDLSEPQRKAIACALKLDFWSLDECERLEMELGRRGISVVTAFFEAGKNDEMLIEFGFNPRYVARASAEVAANPWCCDLLFELREEQPEPRHASGRGLARTAAVLSATWAALLSGELGDKGRQLAEAVGRPPSPAPPEQAAARAVAGGS